MRGSADVSVLWQVAELSGGKRIAAGFVVPDQGLETLHLVIADLLNQAAHDQLFKLFKGA